MNGHSLLNGGARRRGLAGLGIATSLLAGVFMLVVPGVASANANEASYWEGRTEHPSTCYKHDQAVGSNNHGSSDGSSVTLNPFNQAWPGDHWELLVVKGGSDNNGGGDAVYAHPSAGVEYFPPINPNNGTPFGVSHWIVCKGTTPATTTSSSSTTTTTTESPATSSSSTTTTTTESPATSSSSTTTTTTESPATSSSSTTTTTTQSPTIPSSITSTTTTTTIELQAQLPPAGPTDPPAVAPPTAPTPGVQPPTASTPGVQPPAVSPPTTRLPATGSSPWTTALLALMVLSGGTLLVRVSRRTG